MTVQNFGRHLVIPSFKRSPVWKGHFLYQRWPLNTGLSVTNKKYGLYLSSVCFINETRYFSDSSIFDVCRETCSTKHLVANGSTPAYFYFLIYSRLIRDQFTLQEYVAVRALVAIGVSFWLILNEKQIKKYISVVQLAYNKYFLYRTPLAQYLS
jgi:hypothetical protein